MNLTFKSLLILLLLSVPAVANPQQDALRDIQKFSGLLRKIVAVSSSLVGDRAEAAKIKANLKQILDNLEKHYDCKAIKSVDIDSRKRSITVKFVSKSNPVLSFLVIAQNGDLTIEQATIGGYKVVNVDPHGIDR